MLKKLRQVFFNFCLQAKLRSVMGHGPRAQRTLLYIGLEEIIF